MDVATFALAALRLAPVQCAAWGHPITTGHPTIDDYFTCARWSRRTARRTTPRTLLAAAGHRHALPARRDAGGRDARALSGCPRMHRCSLCPQSLFKIHPDNDGLFADVLAAHRARCSCCSTDAIPRSPISSCAAPARCAPRSRDRERARVLPQLPHPDYLRVNRVCDAMLDTLHWSGGNTSLDALACGLPVVTLPGALMRGRQSAGMLRVLGVTELIARGSRRLRANRHANGSPVTPRGAASIARAHRGRTGHAVRRPRADRAPAGDLSGSRRRRSALGDRPMRQRARSSKSRV